MSILFLIVITLWPVGVLGATYETVDGQQIVLRKIDGTAHSRTGNLGPGRNLRWAALEEADLRRANLSFADLRNGNMEDANLAGANLHNAVLGGVTLRGVNLHGCDLSGAQLNGADFRGARHWNHAEWEGARYEQGSEPHWPKGFTPDVSGIVVEQRR